MRLTLTAANLKAALDVAAPAVSKRAQIQPVLGHVLLDARDGMLTVSGDDTQQRAWQTVPADVAKPGAVTLPPRVILDLVEATAPTDLIAISVTATHKATLSCGTSVVKAAGLNPEQFPAPLSFDAPLWEATMPAEALRKAVASVAHATAPDDSRPVMAGIQIKVTDGTLTLAAADGYRLAICSVEAPDAGDVELVAHGKGLTAAARGLTGEGRVRLAAAANGGALLVASEAGCWSVRLIDGAFPDFRRIVPTETPTLVTVGRDDLVRATRLIRNVVTTLHRDGREVSASMARLSIGADGIAIRAANGDQEAETAVPCRIERGQGLAITFNGGYFRDALDAIDAERVALELTAASRPALVRADGERNGHLQVVMPLDPKVVG